MSNINCSAAAKLNNLQSAIRLEVVSYKCVAAGIVKVTQFNSNRIWVYISTPDDPSTFVPDLVRFYTGQDESFPIREVNRIGTYKLTYAEDGMLCSCGVSINDAAAGPTIYVVSALVNR